jgi:gamma-glutamyltranspeptidase/glutathione hydrolase
MASLTLRAAFTALALLALAPGATAQDPRAAPEALTGIEEKTLLRTRAYMVVAANPYASRAGQAIIEAGGSAVDAAVAVQLVLGLVEPQSSGIGGGGFILHYDAAAKTVATYDGRETAPAAATETLFLKPDGTAMSFGEAVVGGRSVGVPGIFRLLETAHREHGRLPWAALFAPAIRLAEEGFIVSPRLARLLAGERSRLAEDQEARAYFYDEDGNTIGAGFLRKNPAYAAVLRAVAEGGADAFYRGPIAEAIVAKVRTHPNPGGMALADLANYTVKKREPVCGPYRGRRVCSMGPPGSGGLAMLQVLGMLNATPLPARDLAGFGPESLASIHRLLEASKLAFADREVYLADPDFVAVPVKGLLDPDYLATRAALIDPAKAMERAPPGTPPLERGFLTPPAQPTETLLPSTSHISIVDREGNIVSFTTSIETAFGAQIMVKGFLLNNQLTDFSFQPERDGRKIANRVEPGKRPRSTMAPTIIFNGDGTPLFVIGSPGGIAIAGFVTKTVIGVLDWGLDVQQAIDFPNMLALNGPTLIDPGPEAAALKAKLEALGHRVRAFPLASGMHGILITKDGYEGGADKRREGVALGR